jgi:hypothetical protein
VAVVVVVVVAGVITVGHGQGHENDHVYDHHRTFRSGTRLDHGKVYFSGTVRPFVSLVTGLRRSTISAPVPP